MSGRIRVALLFVVSSIAAVAGLALWQEDRDIPLPAKPPETRALLATLVPVAPPAPDIIPAPQPSSEVPTLADASDAKVAARVEALAGELRRMWTRNPEHLVSVIEQASRSSAVSPPVTLMLAIAHAETNGKILDVSEAGAVGLAQATPIAYLQEGFDRKLFVTTDYVTGSRAYIMKKPLGDAYTIATLAAKGDKRSLKKASRLLDAAFTLRREGIDELEILEKYAPKTLARNIARNDAHNLARLRELRKMLKHPEKKALLAYAKDVRAEYHVLRDQQLASWKQYQADLVAERDRLLLSKFGATMRTLDEALVYDASEYLAAELDDRFSAKQMAAFLVRHLETKRVQATRLAAAESQIEAMTAALYNGGSHNVKRMLAGLIASLPETEKYMKKVPATRRKLDATVAAIESTSGGAIDGRIRTIR